MMEDKLRQLKERLAEINDLEKASAVLGWDQATYMPPGGSEARARQSATLDRLAQEKFTDPAIGKLLDELQPYAEGLPYDSDDASLIRVTRRNFERMTKVPAEFIWELSEHSNRSYQVWAEARPENDFAKVQPYLEKTLDLSRQMAGYFPGYEHIIDPLIDFDDFGMKASIILRLFSDLRKELVPLVQAITSQPPADDACLKKHYPHDQQIAICKEIVGQLGYDFQRGRLDLTHHPFETNFAVGDVRITTRVKEEYLNECLFSVIHESGHAMYEQGVRQELETTPLGGGASSGVHESQSRLWENLVGRSRGFWEYFYPRLQAAFPGQLGSVTMDEFYQAINKVERSLIRTDADEVTYNLHVMLRFDLEMALLEGRLAVKDLPEAWNERFKQDIGVTPSDNKDGCMQDVHWYGGIIGGTFQGYTLGNILGAQFYDAAIKQDPRIPERIRRGEFKPLHSWLTENIYQHGSKFTPNELVKRITGGPIQIGPYIQYLKSKYGELYQLNFG
jgi:carboxypeptidase Taq